MSAGDSGMKVVPASEIRPSALRMLWREHIPAATLSVIAGKPGLGKSSLSIAIAAELSRAEQVTLISNHEDDLAAVVRPRLDVAGADLDFVGVVPPESAPILPRDMAALEGLIRRCRASCLILDPVAAHFAPERRVHDRPTLRWLVEIARNTGCAIIAIHHTLKTLRADALDVIGGPSSGLVGSARAVYVYGYDRDDEDRRALACAKINGIDQPPTLVLEHETVEYRSTDALIEAGRLRFVGETSAGAKSVLRRGTRRRERDGDCVEWLTLFLAAGDDCARRSQEIRDEGVAAGFGWQTLRRAGLALKTEKVRVGWGGDGFWLWRLPDQHPLRNPDGEEAVA